MPPKTLTPQEVQELFKTDPTAVYVDVRTVAEFAAGHPRGKIVNVPILFRHPTTNENYPNTSFLEVVRSLYASDAPLIVGCEKGQRAQQAAEQLQHAGYSNINIMPDGYAGWRAQQLPTTTDNRDGISYVSLLMPVKRKGKKKSAAHA
ncbi:MAG: rhodanese-like domain-containing protein [Deltaproteobacteria bacterium]|nr:rhodanese-like domain-containing protein [Deltaproteobacteria bacterium]